MYLVAECSCFFVTLFLCRREVGCMGARLTGGKRERLTDQQYRAIELLANGESDKNVADIIGVNRKTVWAWRKTDLFKDELDRQILELKKQIESKLAMQVEPLMDNLIKLALTSKDESIKLKATTYALDRLYGKATSKQDINVTTTDKTAQLENIDDILKEIDVDVVDVDVNE